MPLPSSDDLKIFLRDDKAKSMYIAQQNAKNGEVEGYFVLMKTRKTKPYGHSPTEGRLSFVMYKNHMLLLGMSIFLCYTRYKIVD